MTITSTELNLVRLRPKPLTAAAVNLADGVNTPELARQLKRHQAWQQDAAGYFSEIGEIHYVVNRAAAALSEATLYAATMSESGAVVPVDAPESSVSPTVAATAQAVLAELRSPVGGQKQIVHQAYVNAEIPGEFFLIDASEDGGEPAWWVRSILETTIREPGQPVSIRGIGDVPYDSVSRVWRPHPMRFEAADSGMRPILSNCELVILIDRQFRAAMKSRLFAGLLLLPSGLRQGVTDISQKNDPRADPIVVDFLDALNEAIGEEGSASAVTPNFLWGASDDLREVRRVEFAQQIDPEVLKLRDSAITRIIQGLEYPPEIVTGTGDVSHWGAWFVGDDFINHIRPKGDFLADGFTTVFQRPGMEARGVPADEASKVFLAFDYSALARKPNIVEVATLAHDRYVISDESLRRDLGYDEDDKPEPEEVAARVARRQVKAGGVAGEVTGPPSEGAVTASAFSNTLGGRLTRLDAELRERLLGATIGAIRRATEKAGNRAKSKVASAHREAVATVNASDVCAQLGPTLLAAAGVTEDELLDGGVDGLEKDYRRWTEAAAVAALALTGVTLAGEQLAAWRLRMLSNVDASWEWFSSELRGTLNRLLMVGGDPSEAALKALVRMAVAAAGGATELGVTGGGVIPVSAVTGIGTGPLTLEMLAEAGGEVAGWRWVHDSPEHPFPPHEALDGAEASTVDEFSIGFGDWPGNHAGCKCEIEVIARRPND